MTMSEISFKLGFYRRYGRMLLVATGILALAWGSSIICGARWDLLFHGLGEAMGFLVKILPPDLSAFGDMWEPALSTVFIALVGTLVGTALAVVFALLAASNVAPAWLRNTTRAVLGLERALPEIVVLLFLVA